MTHTHSINIQKKLDLFDSKNERFDERDDSFFLFSSQTRVSIIAVTFDIRIGRVKRFALFNYIFSSLPPLALLVVGRWKCLRRLTLSDCFDPRNTAFQSTTKPPIPESGANCSSADVVPSHSSINRPVQQLTGISMRFRLKGGRLEIYCFDLLCSLHTRYLLERERERERSRYSSLYPPYLFYALSSSQRTSVTSLPCLFRHNGRFKFATGVTHACEFEFGSIL